MLSNIEKDIVKNGKEFLEKNDINSFMRYLRIQFLSGVWRDNSYYTIRDWVVQNIPDVISYCREEIPARMFENCSIITEAIIPTGVTIIGTHAFEDCVNLDSVSIAPTVKLIRQAAFSNTALLRLTIPDSVVVIEDSNFARCYDLKEIKMSKNIKRIEVDSFYELPSDYKIYIDKSVDLSRVEWQDFEDCKDHIVRI